MTTEGVLGRLEGVRRSARGWMARCSAHDNRRPSLSVREGKRRVLLKCFALCTETEIVGAMGLALSDLFYQAAPRDHTEGSVSRRSPHHRPCRPSDWRQKAAALEDAALDLWLASEPVLRAASGLHPEQWTDEEPGEAWRLCVAPVRRGSGPPD